PIDAGDYTILYTLTASSQNYTIVGQNPIAKTFTITKRQATINLNEDIIFDKETMATVNEVKEVELTSENSFVNSKPLLAGHNLSGSIFTTAATDGIYSDSRGNLVYDFKIMQGIKDVTANYDISFVGNIVIEHKY